MSAAASGVSPLIRFGRWSALTVGLLYGYFHHGKVARVEAVVQKNEETKAAKAKAKHEEQAKLLAGSVQMDTSAADFDFERWLQTVAVTGAKH
eukprot:m.214092 g.214092  ORF g.214092 m.214092 type:complete len:93 (+) comp18617_c0_seq3:5713-5991(+)